MDPLRKQYYRLRNFLQYRNELGLSAAIALAGRNYGQSDVFELKVRGIRTQVLCRARDSDFQVLRQVVGRRESDVLAASVRPRLIIDGGGNVGYSSLVLANHYPDCKIIAVEPEPKNCEIFARNCKDYPNIQLVQGAIWHTAGRLDLNVPDRSDSFQVHDSSDGSVRAYTVLELIEMSGENRADLLKLDIEGAEVEVLTMGNENWINRVDTVLVELHERFRGGCEAALNEFVSNVKHTRSKVGEYDMVQLRTS